MANIHAINAQGTEYGITAENGITQAQEDAIATIGDVADLETTAKTTLVEAINEVNGKLPTEQILYENQTPESSQPTQRINVTNLANAKALKITYGEVFSGIAGLQEETFPLMENKSNTSFLSQVQNTAGEIEQRTCTRRVLLNNTRTLLTIEIGTLTEYNSTEGTTTVTSSPDVAKVTKVVAIF